MNSDRRGASSRRTQLAACALLLAGLLLATFWSLPAGGAEPRANLVIPAFRFIPMGQVRTDGPDLTLIQQHGVTRFGYVFIVRNDGRRAAADSTAVVFLDGRRIDAVQIPRLSPFEDRLVKQDERRSIDPGFHQLAVCVDFRDEVEESNERRNCRRLRFAALPQFWDVRRFTLAYSIEGPTANARAVGMNFGWDDFIRIPGQGYLYLFRARGAVHEEVGGSEDHGSETCTYSGSGQVRNSPWSRTNPPRPGYLFIDDSLRKYGALVWDRTNRAIYQATQACTLTGTSPYAERIDALGTVSLGSSRAANDDDVALNRSTTPGAVELEGARVFSRRTGDGVFTQTYNYRWRFVADIP